MALIDASNTAPAARYVIQHRLCYFKANATVPGTLYPYYVTSLVFGDSVGDSKDIVGGV
jgi:hypothetical protein